MDEGHVIHFDTNTEDIMDGRGSNSLSNQSLSILLFINFSKFRLLLGSQSIICLGFLTYYSLIVCLQFVFYRNWCIQNQEDNNLYQSTFTIILQPIPVI